MQHSARNSNKEDISVSVSVVYWSGTGNTEAMANAVAEGITEAGGEAKLIPVSEANVDELATESAFALGCPSMGVEVLEEEEMEPFVETLESKVGGKNILLFGSYGWGDGEWMRNWVERMKNAGAFMVEEEGIIANDAPDDEAVEACKAGGRALVK